jgi:hypothetical protein
MRIECRDEGQRDSTSSRTKTARMGDGGRFKGSEAAMGSYGEEIQEDSGGGGL